MDPNMVGDVGEMIVKRVSVPIGLEELMEGLVKEVLLTKPDDIYIFAAKYFSQLLTHRDKSQHKGRPNISSKTMRSAQSLKGQGEKRFSTKIPVQAATKQLTRQFSIREESPNKNLESPIISQKPRMHNRIDHKFKRKDNGPQTIKENQSKAARKQLSRSVSNERSSEVIGSNTIRKDLKKTDSPRDQLKNKGGPKRENIRTPITGLPVELEESNKLLDKERKADGTETHISSGNESEPLIDRVVEVKAEAEGTNGSVDVPDNFQEGSGKTDDLSMGNNDDNTHETIENTMSPMKPDRNEEWEEGNSDGTPQEQKGNETDHQGCDEKPEGGENINIAVHEDNRLGGTEAVPMNEQKETDEVAMKEILNTSSLEKNNEPDVPNIENIKEEAISTNLSQSDASGENAQEKDEQKPEDDHTETKKDDSSTSGKKSHEKIEEETCVNGLKNDINSDALHTEKKKEDSISSNSNQSVAQNEMAENGVPNSEDEKKETRVDDFITPDKSTHEATEGKNELNPLKKNNVPDASYTEKIKEDPITSNLDQSGASDKISQDEMKQKENIQEQNDKKETSVNDSVTPDKSTHEAIGEINNLNSLEKNNVSDSPATEEIKEDLIPSNSSHSDASSEIAHEEIEEKDKYKPKDVKEETSLDTSNTSGRSNQEAIEQKSDLTSLKNDNPDASQTNEMKENSISSNSSQSDAAVKITQDEMDEKGVQSPADDKNETSVDDSITPDESTHAAKRENNDLNSSEKNNVPDDPLTEEIKEDYITPNLSQLEASSKINQEEIENDGVQKSEDDMKDLSKDESGTPEKHAQDGKKLSSNTDTTENVKVINEAFEKTHASNEKPEIETKTLGENEREWKSEEESKPKESSSDLSDGIKNHQKETEKTSDSNMIKNGDDSQVNHLSLSQTGATDNVEVINNEYEETDFRNGKSKIIDDNDMKDHMSVSQTATSADAKEKVTSKTEEPKTLTVDNSSTSHSSFTDDTVGDEPNNEVIEKVTKKVDSSEGVDSPVKDYDSEIPKTTTAVEMEVKESEKPVERSCDPERNNRETKIKSNQFEISSSSEDGANILQREQIFHELTLPGVKNLEDLSKEMPRSNEISGVSEENIEEHANDTKKRGNIAHQIGDTEKVDEIVEIHKSKNTKDATNMKSNNDSSSSLSTEIGVKNIDELKRDVTIGDRGEKSTDIEDDSSGASIGHEIHKRSIEDTTGKTVKDKGKETFSINKKNEISIEKGKQGLTSVEEVPFSSTSTADSNTAKTEDNKVSNHVSEALTSKENVTQSMKTDDKEEPNEKSALSNSTSIENIQYSIEKSGSKEIERTMAAGDAPNKSAHPDDQIGSDFSEKTDRESSDIVRSSVTSIEKQTSAKNSLDENITDESLPRSDNTENVFDALDKNSGEKILANEELFVKKMVTPLEGDPKSRENSFVSENHESSSESTKTDINKESGDMKKTSENSAGKPDEVISSEENENPLDEIKKSSVGDENYLIDTRGKIPQEEQPEPEDSESKSKSSGIVERVAKNYVNYVIEKEKNAAPENENEAEAPIPQDTSFKTVQSPEDSGVKGSFDSSKLREELQKVEEESKFTTFKPTFNPLQLHQEIENASHHKKSSNETEVHHSLAQAAAVLRIQSMWRGFKVRRNLGKPKIVQQQDENSSVLKKNNQIVPVAREASDGIQQAIILIQKFWRGYKTRRDLKKMLFQGKKVADECKHSDAMLAAVKIQKMWRGFRTRSLLQIQNKSNEATSDRKPISKDSIDSMNTVIFNDPTKDHRTSTGETREHPGMNSSLDEILDYPVIEEQHLIDTYQNKLLDKISGKSDDSNEDLEAYKALTSKRLEELESEEQLDLGGVQASLLSKPHHGVKPKLESLAEEPTDDKLYTFCSTPSQPSKHHYVVSKSPEVETKNKDENGGSARLLHSGELHDSLVLPLRKEITESVKPFGDGTASVAAKSEDEIAKALSAAGLLHTGEWHDSLVLPLTIGKGKSGDVAEGRVDESSRGSSAAVPVVSVNVENGAGPVGVRILQAPAAAAATARGAVTSRRAHARPSAIASEPLSESRQPSIMGGGEEGDETAAHRGLSTETEAARKIQAGFRGYQVRKQLKMKNGSSDMSMSNPRRQTRPKMSQKESPKSKPKEIEEKSAVKIQAGVRGFLVRRRQKKQINQ